MSDLVEELTRQRDEARNKCASWIRDWRGLRDLCRQLDEDANDRLRERDEAREDATNFYAKIGEFEFERDELKKIVEQRILVGAEIHNRANSLIKQNDKTEAECERLRKQLTAATSALRQIHLEVGDWIRSTIIV